MLDIKFICKNADTVKENLTKRGNETAVGIIDMIVDLHQKITADTTELQSFETRNNVRVKEMGRIARELKSAKTVNPDMIQAFHEMRDEGNRDGKITEELKSSLRKNKEQRDSLALLVPNLLDERVPAGLDETMNRVIKEVWPTGCGNPICENPKEHWEIGSVVDLFDFDRASKISGPRFAIMKGRLARLERALGQFMLDAQVANGFVETAVPVIVTTDTMIKSDKLPKFADQAYKLASEDQWLVPTAEVPLVTMYSNELLDDILPIRHVAMSNCFRSEAGAGGRDTKGLIRQHQFQKVELVSIVHPDESDAELEKITSAAESILEMLGLPYRRILLCSGDTGFGARMTYDLEVWLPGQKAWREISSCSNVGDFQARRANIRFKKGSEKPIYAHTLNGSGLAVGRTLVAVLENYQTDSGNIMIPQALYKYLNNESCFA